MKYKSSRNKRKRASTKPQNELRGRQRKPLRQRKVRRERRNVRTARSRKPRYSSLATREKAAYDRTTALITDLRRGEGSYTELLRKHHISSRTARKYAGQDLIGGTHGQSVRASRADRRVRDLMFTTQSGDVPIRTRSSKDATKLSEFFQDRDKLLRGKLSTGQFEAKWRGMHIAGQEVFADTATIFIRAEAGDMKLENLYASTSGAR